jgi:hypothetical protein
VDLPTADEILQMFRDFGLGSEDERRRLLSKVQLESAADVRIQSQVFIRVESTTSPREEGDAQLA